MDSYLPPFYGLLPPWLFLVSIISAANSIQAYITTHFTSRVYSPGAVNPLSSRTFGTWTLLSSIIRMYAAYNISNQLMYQLTLWTYALALAHFLSEWLIFGTAKIGRGLVGPLIVATTSLVWMLTQWEFYSMNGWTIQVAEDLGTDFSFDQ